MRHRRSDALCCRSSKAHVEHPREVGGLELETASEATTRTPLLGRLPLLGALFRNRTNESSRSRFYVFLRASTLRNESFADLRHATRPVALEAGIDEGWPRLEPRWIR